VAAHPESSPAGSGELLSLPFGEDSGEALLSRLRTGPSFFVPRRGFLPELVPRQVPSPKSGLGIDAIVHGGLAVRHGLLPESLKLGHLIIR
jgi:hypothetical protein